ncbi:hypothetical protein ACFS6H_01095 [Terrimonas rubra]|uniref:Outer membrane protein beta-barrel domain-containing protein n=1 Tax=Terrimonas rubra TaxID=1035890 RepID=A0ABW6A0H2_9BACT
MDREHHNRNFERFLQESVDDYQMLPSEKVWKGINDTLHIKRRLYAIGLIGLFMLTVTAVTAVMLSYPVKQVNVPEVTQLPVNDFQSNKTMPVINEPVIAANNPEILAPSGRRHETANKNSIIHTIPGLVDESVVMGYNPAGTAQFTAITTVISETDNVAGNPLLARVDHEGDPASGITSKQVTQLKRRNNVTATEVTGNDTAQATVTDELVAVADMQKHKAPKQGFMHAQRFSLIENHSNLYNPIHIATIESVTNGYKRPKGYFWKKVDWQLHFTPSISYRKLSENSTYTNSSILNPNNNPFANSRDDINNAVTHKPDLGLEFGLTGKYGLSNRLKVKGGVQLNVNRYDIKAFIYNPQMASVDVSNGSGNNFASSWTYYNTFSGYKANWIKNFYFSASLPIGLEYKIFGNDRTYLGVSGTIQPTYVISNRSHLISSDYKHYVEVPWLIRRVNVNSSFETFAAFRTGKTQWQVGPQIRYQMLSSFQNKYPVKENLFDFGLKIGMQVNQ